MGYKEIALPLAAKGVPTTPVLPNSKKAFLPDFPATATTDSAQILAWDAQYPGYNGAAVARAKLGEVWFLEVDSPEVVKRIETETGQSVPATYRVRSRPGRGHYYWKQTSASIAMGNISQSYVKEGDWSARVDNQYVVAAGSIHPHSNMPYVALRDEPIIEAPDWLVQWLVSQKIEKKSQEPAGDIPKDAHGLIPHGYIHGWMLVQAGRLRGMGLSADAIETALLELVHVNCAPPIDDSRVKLMARSICNFPAGESRDLILTNSSAATAVALAEPEELPEFSNEPYPKFPNYVMHGTSIYEKFVKPVCSVNSRIDYFMWLPAMAMLLNYIGPKIKIKTPFGARPFRGSIYSVIIGKKGKTNKSSSVNDAMNYFNYVGLLAHASRDMKNAEGKILTWTVGSAEALGIGMQKTNCKNALLVYDELSQLVSKVGIESSSLASNLLTMYESGKFENGVKSTKESFSLDPDTYCTSLIACTTDKKFAEMWSRLAGSDTGLDDRFFFILQPELLPQPRVQQYVNTVEGAIETRQRIDKAILKGEFEFEDQNDPRLQALTAIENRYANRAEKWALALAIDLGLDIIDEECIGRAVDIVRYEIATKKYLKSYEAATREGQIQQDIRRTLEMAKGKMAKRDLVRLLHADRYGTTLWGQAYGGLVRNCIVREEGAGTRSDPTYVQLLVKRTQDEEEIE